MPFLSRACGRRRRGWYARNVDGVGERGNWQECQRGEGEIGGRWGDVTCSEKAGTIPENLEIGRVFIAERSKCLAAGRLGARDGGSAFYFFAVTSRMSIYTFGYNSAAPNRIRSLRWVGSAKKDLRDMPEGVQDTFGYALHLAQVGGRHSQAKPMKGFGGAAVLEVVEDCRGDTYRAVYTIRYPLTVYVVHCFQKKSTCGIATPKPDIELIERRLKAVAELERESRT